MFFFFETLRYLFQVTIWGEGMWLFAYGFCKVFFFTTAILLIFLNQLLLLSSMQGKSSNIVPQGY